MQRCTQQDLLSLMWLASPALPVGGFSYSEGLEAAIEWAGIQSVPQVTEWLQEQLSLTLGRAELPALMHALGAWRQNDLALAQTINEWLRTTRESSEMRLQTEQMGKSLCEWIKTVHAGHPERVLLANTLQDWGATYPVAHALAASFGQAGNPQAALAYAFGWAENMVQAAIKAVPLGQSAGQTILRELAAHIPTVVDEASRRTWPEDRQSFSPMLAILSSMHEHQYTRIFRS